MVGGGSAGTAVGAVHGEEVRGVLQAAVQDTLAQFIQQLGLADHGFHAHRFAGDLAHPVDHVQQVIYAVHVRVAVGAEGVLSGGDASGAGDHIGHLGARQYTALARFGTLG